MFNLDGDIYMQYSIQQIKKGMLLNVSVMDSCLRGNRWKEQRHLVAILRNYTPVFSDNFPSKPAYVFFFFQNDLTNVKS